jgi:sugar phosphate isomerase/epimerase
MKDLSRLAVHSITTKPWPLAVAVKKFAAAGACGISVWKESLEGMTPAAGAALIRAAGLSVVSMVRGGFFPAADPDERRRRINNNIDLLRAAAELGAPLVVLVCGADLKVPLAQARAQVEEGLAAILPEAERLGIRLAVEPLHPMYADTRSVVNTMKQANDICEKFQNPLLGVAVDVYHTWWDPELEPEIARCGAMGKIFAFHVCDWRSPTIDMLNDRGLMGEGCIDIPRIRGWVEKAGFSGFVEVEIFSDRLWAMDQDIFLSKIIEAFKEKV